MKILFLSHSFYPDVGGIEVHSEILADAFHNAGHIVHLVTWSTDNTGRKFPYEVRRNPNLISLVRAHMWADIVYENNPCLRLSWPAYFLRKTVVVALHTWICRSDGRIQWQDRLKLRWLKRASYVVAVSDSVRRKCWPDATVIANPYRADLFTINPNIKRARNFVFVGRLVSDKGVEIAIEAIHQLSMIKDQVGMERPRFSLTIIGDGPERKKLDDLVNHLDIKDAVSFTGLLRGDLLASCLNDHKFIIVPSRWEEPFGNVALEGMACGCIPIVSDGGGLPDAVGRAGVVFARGDVAALTKCILNLLEDESLQIKLRTEAPRHLAAHLPHVIANRYLTVINHANYKEV